MLRPRPGARHSSMAKRDRARDRRSAGFRSFPGREKPSFSRSERSPRGTLDPADEAVTELHLYSTPGTDDCLIHGKSHTVQQQAAQELRKRLLNTDRKQTEGLDPFSPATDRGPSPLMPLSLWGARGHVDDSVRPEPAHPSGHLSRSPNTWRPSAAGAPKGSGRVIGSVLCLSKIWRRLSVSLLNLLGYLVGTIWRTRGESCRDTISPALSQTSLLREGVHRKQRLARKPGKCSFRGRPCGKSSVPQKRIGLPAAETKSSLYKHSTSRIRRLKAGPSSTAVHRSLGRVRGRRLVGNQKDPDETEGMNSQYKSEQQGSLPSALQDAGERALQKRSSFPSPGAEETRVLADAQRTEGAHAVKQRLAMRLSERRRTPGNCSDDAAACMDSWSKGSTESGYFSHSESSELPQASPPNAESKSYAEIILGKFGRVDQGPRNAHLPYRRSSEPERRRIPLNVPTTEVIEHITKLITINEALVNTREIDSVKPRRSLSRKNSLEAPRVPRAPCTHRPKGEASGSGSVSSVDVKCLANDLLPRFLSLDSQPRRPSPVSLLRSRSVPSPAGTGDAAAPRFRFSHSFDERQAAPTGKRVGRHHGILRRQPALEVPFDLDAALQEVVPCCSVTAPGLPGPCEPATRSARQSDAEACTPCVRSQNVPETHLLSSRECPSDSPKRKACHECCHQVLPDTLCKKQGGDSQELEERISDVKLLFSSPEKLSGTGDVMLVTSDGRDTRKGISVIRHTSAFDNRGKTVTASPSSGSHQPLLTDLPQPPSIFCPVCHADTQGWGGSLTKESGLNVGSRSSAETLPRGLTEEMEKFQWPRRSATLAQFPAEKLPPKKKRLCLVETQPSVVPSLKPSVDSSETQTSSLCAGVSNEEAHQSGEEDLTRMSPASPRIVPPAKLSFSPFSHGEPSKPLPSAELRQNELSLPIPSPIPPPADRLSAPIIGSTFRVSSTSVERPLLAPWCPTASPLTCSVIPLCHQGPPSQPVPSLVVLQGVNECSAAPCSPELTGLLLAAELQQQETKLAPCPPPRLLPLPRPDRRSRFLDIHGTPTTVPVRIQNPVPVRGEGVYTSQSHSMLQRGQMKVEGQRASNPCVELPVADTQESLPWTPLKSEVTGVLGKKRPVSQASSLELFPDEEPLLKRTKQNADDEGNGACEAGGESKQPPLTCEKNKEAMLKEFKKVSDFSRSETSKEEDSNNKRDNERVLSPTRTNEAPNSCLHTATVVTWCYLKVLDPSGCRDVQTSGCSSSFIGLPSSSLQGNVPRSSTPLPPWRSSHLSRHFQPGRLRSLRCQKLPPRPAHLHK
ncbi:hypothetical protein GN956_G16443 [Arapaima gigas]